MNLRQYLLLAIVFLASIMPIGAIECVAQEAPTEEGMEEPAPAPLIYVGATDRWPYIFLDEATGKPSGYNIDLLNLIFGELGLSYESRLSNLTEARADIHSGRADLMLDMRIFTDNSVVHTGRNIVQLFTHSVATAKHKPVFVRTIQDMGNPSGPIYTHKESYTYKLMLQNGWEQFARPFTDVDEAVRQVSETGEGCIVWNTLSLEWSIRRNHIDNLQLTAISMPLGEYRFVARDTVLLARLDSMLIVLDAEGRLEPLRAKWLYPDEQPGETTGIPSWLWLVLAAVAFLSIVLIVYNIIYYNRDFKERQRGLLRDNRLAQILQISHIKLWTFDVATQTFSRITNEVGEGFRQMQFTSLAFASRFHSEEFDNLYDAISSISEEKEQQRTMELHVVDDEDDLRQEHHYVLVMSVLRREKGKPRIIMSVLTDVTDERMRQRGAHERLMRYQTVFNTAMVDMVYFDEQGYVRRMNERVQRTFGITQEEAIANRLSINTSVIGSMNVPTESVDGKSLYHATQEIRRSNGTMMYYDIQIVPVRSSSDRLLGYYGTGRDVTEMANAYKQVRLGIKQLREATQEVTQYVRNINYVLGVGGVRIAKYSPHTHTLTIFRSLDEVQLTLTQARCMTLVDDASKRIAMRVLDSMDSLTRKTVEASIGTCLRLRPTADAGVKQMCLQLRFVPTYGEDGEVQGYFGLCRDVSDIKATEKLLAKETARAQEVEMLKNSFLRNMSYEIRTPLNAVVGFAELFEQEHAVEDEAVFIEEIKRNSSFLLTLINDILFLSRLDAHMIEITPQPTDFAQTFEAHCHIGWSSCQKEGVRYVVDSPYSQLVLNIDEANLGRIVEQVVANAAQHTEWGLVRAHYEYVADRLLITVDDTGSGIPRETIDHIFDRFVSGSSKGTGLGLPICKELATQMGGSINITSQEGKGTTVWIAIPCEMISFERAK